MADFSSLKTAIQNAIRTNGNNEITGQLLQDILLSMVVVLGDEAITNVADDLSTETSQRQNADGTLQGNINGEATARATADAALQNAINTINSNISNGYVYAGIATPSATPVTGKVFYIATTAGTYTNFGGLTVTKGINILKYNGSTWSQEKIIGIDDYPTAGSSKLALSGGIDAEIKSLVGYYTCGTAAATAAKTIAASAYILLQGGSIKVKFTYKNTAADATLKIGSADAKPLFYGGRRAGSSNSWEAGEVVEIFYDGTNYMANNVMGGGAGDGAFDISVYNAVDGTPTPYADLAAALGTNGANIPDTLCKGGMSVKFIQGTVQSSDHKYVQYRLMSDSFNTTPANWQGIDEEPTAGSDNLVKSGGVYQQLKNRNVTGDDDTFVWENSKISVVSGHTYRFYIVNPDVPMTGVTVSASRFAIGTAKAFSPNPLVNILVGHSLDDYYDVTIPDNVNVLYWGCRCNQGEALYMVIEDISAIKQLNYTLFEPIRVPVSAGTDGINELLYKYSNGCVLLLERGEYSGVDGIKYHQIRGSQDVKICNSRIIGIPGQTLITRDTTHGPSAIYTDSSETTNNIVENVIVNSQISRPTGTIAVYNSTVGGKFVDDNINPEFAAVEQMIKDLYNTASKKYAVTGRGNELVWSDGITVVPNHKYRLIVNNDISLEGLTGYLLVVNSSKTTSGNLFGIYVANGLESYYDVTIPDGVSTIYYSVKTASQQEFSLSVVDIEDMSNSISMPFENGKAYVNQVIGNTATKSSVSGWSSIKIACIEGSIFNVVAAGGSGYRMWSTLNENGVIIRTADSNIIKKGSGLNITIANGEKYLIVNNNNSDNANPSVTLLNKDSVIEKLIPVNTGEYVLAAPDSSENDKLNANLVVTNSNAATKINQALIDYETVVLLSGTYSTDGAITIKRSNRKLIGKGTVNITKQYLTGYGICTERDNNSNPVENTVVENIVCNTSIKVANYGAKNSRITNCYEQSTMYIKNAVLGNDGINDIKLGADKDVEDLDVALDLVSISNRNPNSNYRLLVYGKNTVSNTTRIFINTLDVIGMTLDAELEMVSNGNANDGFLFRDSNTANNISKIKDMLFTRSGECAGYQFAAVRVTGNHLTFENCVFKNDTSISTPYVPAEDLNSGAISGDRRHGCLIECSLYDEKCETVFRNCKGIGSPYGFKNTRGFYIIYGSPKLYSCIGQGGGIGWGGYGIVCHGSSKAYLYDCIGIGSPYGYKLCNGIQFQAASESRLFNCIGYGGTGYQYISTGGRANYQKQNVISGESYGIGCLMTTTPLLDNCKGFAGDGEDSIGLYMRESARPIIKGGYYGKDLKMYQKAFAVDSGLTYMTLSDFGNDNRNVDIEQIYSRDVTGWVSGYKIVLKTNNGIIAESTSGVQENYAFEVTTTRINANDTIQVHVEDSNGNDVSSGVTFKLFIRYKVANAVTLAQINGNAYPTIKGVLFDGNKNSDGLEINTSANNYIIDSCMVKIPSTKYAVKSTESRSNVRVANCLFTSQLTQNITSFIQPVSVGSNSVVE